MSQTRRQFIGLIAGLAGYSVITQAKQKGLSPTPAQTEGPFYPVHVQKDKDFDLTQIEGHQQQAQGHIIWIEGQVVDTQGQPIEDAVVDLWQANAAGRYRHINDKNPVLLDENFQGWAIVHTGKQGKFKFKTIMPGAYPASSDWTRPPHIHFKIAKAGFNDLTTQLYFPDQPLNDVDRLLQRLPSDQQQRLIAKRVEGEVDHYYFEIVLG